MKLEGFLLRWVGNSSWLPKRMRMQLLRHTGVQIADGVVINPNVYFHSSRVEIGKGSFVNSGTRFVIGATDDVSIKIGSNVQIGPDCSFVCVTHKIGDSSKRAGKSTYHDIVVEDGVWIGANVTIIPGVTINKGCVIAAGATVIHSTKPNGLYAGVPAVLKRTLAE